jgi:hypothetical protein
MAWSFYAPFPWRYNQHWEQFTLIMKFKCDSNEMLSMHYDSGDWNIHNCATTRWTINGPVGLTMNEKWSWIHVTSTTIHPLGTVTIVWNPILQRHIIKKLARIKIWSYDISSCKLLWYVIYVKWFIDRIMGQIKKPFNVNTFCCCVETKLNDLKLCSI